MFERFRKKTKPAEQSATELEEFTDLSNKLIESMVDLALLTLRSIRDKKGAPLNMTQIEETVNFDLQFRMQQIQDPELLDIVREQAIYRFLEEQKADT